MTMLTRQTRVVLRVWGSTMDDAQLAETQARQSPHAWAWQVVEVIPSSGPPCPIPSRDSKAIEQGVGYDAVWAVYPTDVFA
jgi:hypothetical protein